MTDDAMIRREHLITRRNGTANPQSDFRTKHSLTDSERSVSTASCRETGYPERKTELPEKSPFR